MNKKRVLSMLLAVGLTASFMTGCGTKDVVETDKPVVEGEESVVEGVLTDGTYTGTGNGFNGEMSLEVVVKDGKIEDIIMGDHGESAPVFNRALPVIKERIIEDQTPIVDSVSAATFSSFGFKAAVAEALKEAGTDFGDITFNTAPERSAPVELEEVTTQLVVVGGGPSGLAAAISAKQSGVEDVILVEKLDILSGNGKFDMNFFDMINSPALEADDRVVTPEEFILAKEKAVDSDARKEVWAEGAYTVNEWLMDMGINLNFSAGGTNHMAEEDEYAGEHIQDNLEKKAYELGIDIRTGTKGLDLIMEDGKNVGVKVENRDGFYDIKADAVILATGGFSTNKELLAEYTDGARVETSNQMGTTGDFIPVFLEHDLQLGNMDVLSVFKLIIKNRRDLTGAGDGFMLVNQDGERFAAENTGGLDLAHAILDQPEGKVFYIYDQPLKESFYRLHKHNDELGYHFQADTLEELAEILGIDADNLVANAETYNKAVNGDMDDPFRGEDVFDRPFAEEGPYYGVQVESAIHMTKGGVVANEKTQVLNNADEPVEGLYASGEVTDTSGAYSASVVFGRVSGQAVAEYILNK